LDRQVINFPVSRFGRICKADTPLTDLQSFKVAAEIKRQGKKFLARLVRCFDDSGATEIIKSRENIIILPTDTPIINFPSYDIRTKEYLLCSRISVTVCQFARRSKIWSRISLRRIKGRHALELTENETDSFFHFADSLTEEIVKVTFDEYRKLLQDLRASDELYERYSFRLRGINSDDNKLRRLMQDIALRNICTLEEVIAHNDYFGALEVLFKFALNKSKVNPRLISGLKSQKDWDFSFLDGQIKKKPLRSVVMTRPETNITTINCICYNGSKRFNGYMPADLATLELLIDYASRF